MKRKDCDKPKELTRPLRRSARDSCTGIVVAAVGMLLVLETVAVAGTVRVWPTAVVVSDSVTLADMSELRGFDPASEAALRDLVVADVIAPGAILTIDMSTVRDALTSASVNMANVTLSGSVKCSVSRPATLGGRAATNVGGTVTGAPTSLPESEPPSTVIETTGPTLRRSVIDFFNDELERYNGTAEVTFDRTQASVLELTGPAYSFRVRRMRGPVLGSVSIDVDVLSSGRVLQTVPLVVRIAMQRDIVVARHTINQDTIVRASDVKLVRHSFTRLDRLGVDRAVEVVGQRARRHIPAGSIIDADRLEPVPLVERGQLVTLESVSGSVTVVTAAKATKSGFLGDVITVRSSDKRRRVYEGVIVGPGKVRMGGSSVATSARIVLAGRGE
ncbi:MAG: flagellar basal body P-ring formation protein FlgA [Planctomycetes bacterium]|nr:flagellar basal body P-ring formation protein FlgA [Planctomycetota bacterium]